MPKKGQNGEKSNIIGLDRKCVGWSEFVIKIDFQIFEIGIDFSIFDGIGINLKFWDRDYIWKNLGFGSIFKIVGLGSVFQIIDSGSIIIKILRLGFNSLKFGIWIKFENLCD